MSLFSKVVHLANPIVGGATQAAGAVLSGGGLVHNNTADRLTSIGHSITNPNVVYSGPLNPASADFAASGGANWTTLPQGGGGGGGGGRTAVMGANTTNVPGSGIYGAGGGGGSYDPNTDPTVVNSLRGDIGNLMSVFRGAFDAVLNKVDAMAAEKKQNLLTSYDTQQHGLDTNFADTSQGIDNVLSSQGAFNSSYRAGQQGTALDAYKTATSGINTAKEGDLAQVGQYADTTKAGLRAGMPSYDVNNYNTVSDLQTIKDNVDQALKQLGVTGAGLGTNSEYISHLNAIAPKQEQGSGALKGQLDKLAAVNAPAEAKQAIAEQIINNSSGDPAWLDYFNKLLVQTGSAATPTVVTPPATA